MPVSDTYRPDAAHLALGEPFFDPVAAATFPEHRLRFRNDRWAARVGLGGLTDDEWIAHFGRFEPLPDNLPEPLALRYHGHQFRVYNPDIGDGRGFLFAQLRDDRDRLLDLGTKGSGQTPYSRSGDGRLTLKGGVREILATEMLEALAVNTSRTFSLIETGEALQRGDEPSPTRSAVLVRLSHSHVRIGTFQRLAAHQDKAAITRLIEHCIAQYWPSAAEAEDPVEGFYRLVVGAVARMGAQWMAAGFVHGVLNTDNIAITGESFDYGPWRFAPQVRPNMVAAYFDHGGLYSFGRQPQALEWNLARFAECLLEHAPLDRLQAGLESFRPAFDHAFGAAVRTRLALRPSDDPEQDFELARDLFRALSETEIGFEQAFHDLLGGAMAERVAASPHNAAYASEPMRPLVERLRDREPAAGLKALLADPVAGAPPQTMLIDEVEALWAAIAERDDWAPLRAKIDAVRRSGAFQARLATA